MRAPRDPVLLFAVGLVLTVLVGGWLGASAWVGRTFPGFLVLENRTIASAGLTRWPATAGGAIYQHEIVAVDGRPLDSAEALASYVHSRAPGTPITYTLRKGGKVEQHTFAVRLFELEDFLLLFGSYFAGGLAMCGVAIAIRILRRGDRPANATALAIWLIGMWALSATDLYGPYRFFRLHAALECMLGAGMVHFALSFPVERELLRRHPRIALAPYAGSAVLVLVQQVLLFHPSAYVVTHLTALASFGAALVAVVVSQVDVFRHPPSFEARQRVKVLALGVVAAAGPGAFLAISGALTGGQSSENVMGWSGLLLPAALAYAVLRTELFEVDAILRRSVNYAVLTLLLGLAYAGAMAAFEGVLQNQSGVSRAGFVVVFAGVSVAVMIPLRDRIQAPIDRIFFRSAYDFRRLVQIASSRLSAVTELQRLLEQLDEIVRNALQPAWIVLEYDRGEAGPPGRFSRDADVPPTPASIHRAVEAGADMVETPDGGLAVPFRVEGRCAALLVLGRRLSGGFYGGDDRRFLSTLANQGAVAIQNALTLESLRELNQDLELKVRERTSDLASALEDLRSAQGRLVQQEKMASLGQLVAGIAHEINNPVNFIGGNIAMLREHADAIGGAIGEIQAAVSRGELPPIDAIAEKFDLHFVLEDLDPLLAACQEGVDRTTGIVQGLRTFSRLDRAACAEVDLVECLEGTLFLLKDRLASITIEREFEEIPPVECMVGQINQVLLNLLTNAADAISDGGTITLRASRVGDEGVQIEIEDDGRGISAEALDHIFEPFFTTKPVGKGTGLGLSISYGIVERHAGTLVARSEPGRGACFTLTLPLHFPDEEDGADGAGAGSA